MFGHTRWKACAKGLHSTNCQHNSRTALQDANVMLRFCSWDVMSFSWPCRLCMVFGRLHDPISRLPSASHVSSCDLLHHRGVESYGAHVPEVAAACSLTACRSRLKALSAGPRRVLSSLFWVAWRKAGRKVRAVRAANMMSVECAECVWLWTLCFSMRLFINIMKSEVGARLQPPWAWPWLRDPQRQTKPSLHWLGSSFSTSLLLWHIHLLW